MRKTHSEQLHPNDVPVIFTYDENAQIVGKISINEWNQQKQQAQLLEELEIKLYREAITYYSNDDFDKAIDILSYLISRTQYTHYEYVERLATIYRKQKRISKEKTLLLTAKKNIAPLESSDKLIQRIDRRLQKMDTQNQIKNRPLFN